MAKNKIINGENKQNVSDSNRKHFIEVAKLHKSYGDNVVLENINFHAEQNEIVALLGPSGCGKSTLLSILNGIIRPARGSIKMAGEELKGKNKKSVTVFQRTSCFPWLNLLDNIKFSIKRGLWKVDEKKCDELAQNALKRVGLSDYGEYFPSAVSGGMQQRVALARAMVTGAPLVLMDEPFVGLDRQTKELMHLLVMDLWEEHKSTIVLITHDLDEAIFMADRVYVLSARPAEVKSVVEVNLPRPRRPEMKFRPEFIKLEKFLAFITEREVIKASQLRIADVTPRSLKIGIYTWIGIAQFYVAKEIGLFDKYKVDAAFVHLERTDDRTRALASGEVDLVALTLDRFLLDRQKMPALKVAVLLNRSAGGDALLVREEIKHFTDLRGKKIGVEKGWVNQFFLEYLLDKHNIPRDTVEQVDVNESDAGVFLLQQRIDGAVIWEPWLSRIKQLSPTHILASTSREPLLVDALAGTEEILKKRGEDVRNLIHALFEARHYMREHPAHSADIVSAYLGISGAEVEEELKKIVFFDRHESGKFFKEKDKEDRSPVEKLIAQMEEVWSKNPTINYRAGDTDYFYKPFLFE